MMSGALPATAESGSLPNTTTRRRSAAPCSAMRASRSASAVERRSSYGGETPTRAPSPARSAATSRSSCALGPGSAATPISTSCISRHAESIPSMPRPCSMCGSACRPNSVDPRGDHHERPAGRQPQQLGGLPQVGVGQPALQKRLHDRGAPLFLAADLPAQLLAVAAGHLAGEGLQRRYQDRGGVQTGVARTSPCRAPSPRSPTTPPGTRPGSRPSPRSAGSRRRPLSARSGPPRVSRPSARRAIGSKAETTWSSTDWRSSLAPDHAGVDRELFIDARHDGVGDLLGPPQHQRGERRQLCHLQVDVFRLRAPDLHTAHLSAAAVC